MTSVVWDYQETKPLDLGLSDALATVGENIISIQMVGLLIGGIIWGVMGVRREG
jgi:hypothetical protein